MDRGDPYGPAFSSAPLSFADKMQRLCVYVLILALALATFSEASWKPRSRLQDAPSGPGANRGLEPHGLDQLGPASHHRRQLGLQGPPQLVAGRNQDSRLCLPHPARVGPGLGLAANHPSRILTSSSSSDPQTCPRSRDRGWKKKKQHTDGWTSAAAVLRKGTNVPRTELQSPAISQPRPAP